MSWIRNTGKNKAIFSNDFFSLQIEGLSESPALGLQHPVELTTAEAVRICSQ
jgi:hypothetical protein